MGAESEVVRERRRVEDRIRDQLRDARAKTIVPEDPRESTSSPRPPECRGSQVFLIAQRHGWVNRRHPPDRNTVQWDTANRGTASRDWRSLDSCAHTNRSRCVITPGGRLVGCDRESGPTARSRRDSI